MNEPAEKWQLWLVFIALTITMIVDKFTYWKPTQESVQRIEQMKPCAQIQK